jgi:PKD repeat protein
MPQVSTVRVLVVVLSVLVASCASDRPPAAPSSSLPAHGEPATLNVSAVPGIGERGGTATVTAIVSDAYSARLTDVPVTFSADAGTFDAATATTTADGIATTTLTAPPGVVKITATAGSVRTPDVSVAVQPSLGPTTTPLPPQPPTPQPPPPTSPPPTAFPFMVAIVATAAPNGSSTIFDLNVSAPLATAAWTFGDGATGTTTQQHTGHTYAAVGSYAVHVSATDTKGRTATDSTVVAIPAPSYTVTLAAAPTSVVAGGTSTLTATVAFVGLPPAVASWAWDCGNGTGAATPNTAICTYPTAGPFTAKVTVTGGTTSGSATTGVTVSPQPTPIITVACAQPATPPLTEDCSATAKVNGVAATIMFIDWAFGDSTPTATATPGNIAPSHTYLTGAPVTVTASNVIVAGTSVKGTGTLAVTPQ